MNSDIDLVITHDGKNWIARNEEIVAEGGSLPELDANVAQALRGSGRPAGAELRVFMGFDINSIPAWIRQYAPHYFNRLVDVKL